jgi:serine/threonine protein kinase
MTGMGTIAWCAPELLLQEKQGKPCDVWSYGVIMWELCCESVPYGDKPPGAIVLGIVQQTMKLPKDYRAGDLAVFIAAFSDVLSLSASSDAPSLLVDLIEPCQRFLAQERPTFEQVETALQRDEIM